MLDELAFEVEELLLVDVTNVDEEVGLTVDVEEGLAEEVDVAEPFQLPKSVSLRTVGSL